MTCHTFTHHVDEALRVECQEHPSFLVDVTEGEKRKRAIEVQREHEESQA